MRGERITASVRLPQSLEGCQKLTVVCGYAGPADLLVFCFCKRAGKRRESLSFLLKRKKVQQGFLRIRGWAVADEPVKIHIFDENKQKLNGEILRTERVDVEQLLMRKWTAKTSPDFCGTYKSYRKASVSCFYAGDTKSVHIVHLNPAVVFRKK